MRSWTRWRAARPPKSVCSPNDTPPQLGHCPTPPRWNAAPTGRIFFGRRPLTPGHLCPTPDVVKGKEFLRRLRRHGVSIIEGRGKGGHVWVIHQGRRTTVPTHGSRDMDPDFLKDICRQLGLDPKDVL